MRHRALDNVLKNPQYEISEAIVFCNENIQKKDKVLYCPIYLVGMLKKQRLPEDYIYQMDLSILQDADVFNLCFHVILRSEGDGLHRPPLH